MKVRVTFEATTTYEADVELDEALEAIALDGGGADVRELFNAEKLATGRQLTPRTGDGSAWVGGEELSELLWGRGHDVESSETRVLSAQQVASGGRATARA